jgi:hypothetical protein
MKKNPPLLSIMLINSFDGSCGTFGEGKKKPKSSMTMGQFVPKSNNNQFLFLFSPNNNHGVDVNMIIVI